MKSTLLRYTFMAVANVMAVNATYAEDKQAYERFEETVTRLATEYQSNGGAWPQYQDACALCHGRNGQSRNAHYPSLAGLSATYIETQLRAFADGRRLNPQMGPLAANLSDDQIKTIASYYARQKPLRNETFPQDKSLDEKGENVVTNSACASCHGNGLNGSPLAPRLAGQGETYLVDQLFAYKRGERRDPGQFMNGMTKALSEKNIEAVAHYIAGLIPAGEGGE